MPAKWTLLVARRYVRTGRREKGNTAAVLSALGIAVGVLALTVVLAVMNGFQYTTINAILEFNSYHLRVRPADPGSLELPAGLRDAPGLRAAFRFAETQTLVRGFFPDPVAVTVRMLPPDFLSSGLSGLPVLEGTADLGGEDGLLLGAELARRLGVRTGDELRLLAVSGGGGEAFTARELTGRVRGLFRTGYFVYDAGWISAGLAFQPRLEPGAGETSFGVLLDDRFGDGETARRIREADPGSSVESWREFNRAIFGALRLEKAAMMLLIGLIFLVVGGTIFQALRRAVTERSEELALLKALGASPSSVGLVFVLQGLMVGCLGAAAGMALGLLTATRINEIFALAEASINALLRALAPLLGRQREISLFSPRHFYITAIPIRIDFIEAFFIYAAAALSATAAGFAASRRVSSIRPNEVLREE